MKVQLDLLKVLQLIEYGIVQGNVEAALRLVREIIGQLENESLTSESDSDINNEVK